MPGIAGQQHTALRIVRRHFDYASLGPTLRSHPPKLLRTQLTRIGLLTAAQLKTLPDGGLVKGCGIVTMRQHPSTANGVSFVTLEDEIGVINVIVWRAVRDEQRADCLQSRMMGVDGVWQRQGEVQHLVARRLMNPPHLLGQLETASRDLR